MVDEKLTQQERVVLEVVAALGERAEHQAIKTMVREAFRKDLRAVLIDLTERPPDALSARALPPHQSRQGSPGTVGKVW